VGFAYAIAEGCATVADTKLISASVLYIPVFLAVPASVEQLQKNQFEMQGPAFCRQ